jgi:hypothetical protein
MIEPFLFKKTKFWYIDEGKVFVHFLMVVYFHRFFVSTASFVLPTFYSRE